MDFEELFGRDDAAAFGADPGKARPLQADPEPAAITSAGATAMFGTLPPDPESGSPSAKQAEPEAVQPSGAVPVALSASGGFTQLLRALHVEPKTGPLDHSAAGIRLAEPAALEAEAGPMTQLLRTIPSPGEPGSGQAAPPRQLHEAAPVTSFQVTSFNRPETDAVPVDTASSQAQLFTSLFSDRGNNRPAEQKVITALPSTEAVPSFTQMFATLATEEAGGPRSSEPSSELEAEFPPQSRPALESIDVPPPIEKQLAVAADQLLQQDTKPSPALSPSFTQMFQTLRDPGGPGAPPISVPAAMPDPSTTPPGSFTQIFQTLQAAPEGSSEMGSEASRLGGPPGSFTQLFSTIAPASPPVQPPSLPPSPPFYPGERAVEDRPGSPPVSEHKSSAYPPSPRNPLLTPPGPPPASGGLTQLLRALDQPLASTASPRVPIAGPALPAQPGGFTGVYGELAGAPLPVSQPVSPPALYPVAPPAMPVPAPSLGPSEYTRILNASAVRESVLKGGEGASSPAATPSVHAESTPWTPPAAPKLPEAKLPAVALPAVPKPPVPTVPGALQQYIPLLLLLVIFLLVAILVAVVFLMKK